ncbi:MAG: helix-turn-helix domain-containing protein [Rhodospirillaceae bacterium]|nr:helix-turn-helix domain-containing protein [Rhodospirillaceae bacterium]
MKYFAIGQLARETGCKVQTIRYYEQIGLLPAAGRNAGNQRVYSAAHRRRLAFIRHARDLGFSLDAVRELLALGEHPEQPCAKADRIAAAHLAEVESKIARLEKLRAELRRMIGQCDGAGATRVSDCRVIESLADHGHCLAAHHDAAEEAGPGRMGAAV